MLPMNPTVESDKITGRILYICFLIFFSICTPQFFFLSGDNYS